MISKGLNLLIQCEFLLLIDACACDLALTQIVTTRHDNN
jgi:hypothetical protein